MGRRRIPWTVVVGASVGVSSYQPPLTPKNVQMVFRPLWYFQSGVRHRLSGVGVGLPYPVLLVLLTAASRGSPVSGGGWSGCLCAPYATGGPRRPGVTLTRPLRAHGPDRFCIPAEHP